MARLPRIVIPGVAHHVTKRGNRRLPVFFGDEDRRSYLTRVADASAAHGTRCLAWCLMNYGATCINPFIVIRPPSPKMRPADIHGVQAGDA